jgi:hypothetical protein
LAAALVCAARPIAGALSNLALLFPPNVRTGKCCAPAAGTVRAITERF